MVQTKEGFSNKEGQESKENLLKKESQNDITNLKENIETKKVLSKYNNLIKQVKALSIETKRQVHKTDKQVANYNYNTDKTWLNISNGENALGLGKDYEGEFIWGELGKEKIFISYNPSMNQFMSNGSNDINNIKNFITASDAENIIAKINKSLSANI